MGATLNTNIVDGYAELLDNLSIDNKLDLIAKLSASVKKDFDRNLHPSSEKFADLKEKNPFEPMIPELGSSDINGDLETILLNGPVATEEEIALIEANRQAINTWRQ